MKRVELEIDGTSLTLEQVGAVAENGGRCRLAAEARTAIERSRAVVDAIAGGDAAHYGINTGFGDLADVRIPPEDTRTLQERLLSSHAAGVGEPLPEEVIRAMLLLRANTLARGHSGVRPLLVESLLALLRRDVLPVVPERGSVGASGDLAPLAHLALPLVGRGQARFEGRVLAGGEALAAAGLEPVVLEAKEGLALINGTQAMTAITALAVLEVRRLVRIADLVGALSTDALRGADTSFDPRLHALRPHPGQVASAANLWRLLAGSAIRESHRIGDVRVQDPYCVRCMPQVHGAVRDVLDDVRQKVGIEINAVTDNPLIFPRQAGEGAEAEAGVGDVLSGGNFHGEPIAIAADCLALAVAELGSIAERRIDKLTDETFSGLPPFLVEDSGLNSGFMLAQVTAAALASENKGLAHPASTDSIPTSANKEDHVSMGMGAALKLRRVVANARQILAIELLAAAQGIDLLAPLETSEPLRGLQQAVRSVVPTWDRDREMAPDLAAAERFLGRGIQAFIDPLD